MSILDFVSQEDLNDLDDDPHTAFMQVVTLAQRGLHKQSQDCNPDDQYGWAEIQRLQHSFMNVVLATASRLEIDTFRDTEVPTVQSFKDEFYSQFKFDLDHYITQLVLDNSLRSKKDSVGILPKSKDKIRQYVVALRDCVEKSNMTDAKREALLKKLTGFESELEKRRLNMLSVARVAFELMAVPGGCWASYEVANKLITNVMQTVAEAKVAEQEALRIAPATPFKALAPPRSEPKPIASRGGFVDDLDDDVPF